MFAHPVGEQLALTNTQVIFKALSRVNSSNKNVLISLATIYLNFAVSFSKPEPNSELKFECFTSIVHHLNSITESEAVFRFLVGLGTLGHNDPNLTLVLKSEEVVAIVKKFTNPSNPEKVSSCAKSLLKS